MDFLSDGSVWAYFFIFFGKILEVTLATLRIVLINRGERIKGALLAFVEILIWIVVTGTVLTGFQDDLMRVLIFAIAFSLGNYLGSWIEEKLAFGLSSIQVIVPEGQLSTDLVADLRSHNFAVTIVKGEGKDGNRELLFLHIMRKKIPFAISIIHSYVEKAVIIVNDVKVARGGYIKK